MANPKPSRTAVALMVLALLLFGLGGSAACALYVASAGLLQ